MTRKKKKRNSSLPWIITFCVIGVASLAWYVKSGPEEMKSPENAAPIMTVQPNPTEKKPTIQVPVPKNDNGNVVFEMKPKEADIGTDIVVESVNAFLKSSKIATEAKVISAKYEGDHLILDTTKLFDRGYGTDDEHTLFDGIVKAVSANSKVKTLEFLSNGSPVSSLGNIEFNGPIKVREVK